MIGNSGNLIAKKVDTIGNLLILKWSGDKPGLAVNRVERVALSLSSDLGFGERDGQGNEATRPPSLDLHRA
jgi:hypothetical protein